MSKKVTAYGWTDENGKLHLASRERFAADIAQHLKNKDVVLTTKEMGKRTTKQNRYYFGVVVEMIRYRLKETQGKDFSNETIHEWLKVKFNADPVVIEATGELLEIGGSTSELNKEEMTEYIERIKDWCALSLDLIIPEPNTQTELEFKD
jgi:hypothetical protein